MTCTPRVKRKMTHSLLFDGVDDYVEVPDAGLPASTFTSGFTLEAWILPLVGGGRIFDKSAGTSGEDGFTLYVDSGDGRIELKVNGQSAVPIVNSLELNIWQHVVVTVETDGTSTFYINTIDKTSDNSTTALSNITTTNALRIGNRATATDRPFDGNIGTSRIYNRALTADQVSNLYNYNIVPDGCVAEYFNSIDTDGAGTVLTDSVGSNDGTISGATWSTETPYKEPVALPAKMPHVLRFDGVDDYVTFTPSESEVITLDWVLQDNRESNYPSTDTFKMFTTNKFYISFRGSQIRFGSGHNSHLSVNRIVKRPYRITGTYDGTTAKLYLDGLCVASGSITVSGLVGDDGYLGGQPSNARWFDGLQFSARCHETALTAQEIYNLHHYNIIPTEGLVGNWNEISDDGTTLIDNSGNSNDGTITGATRVTDLTGISKPSKAIVPYVGSVEFDGSDDIVTFASKLSMTAWTAITVRQRVFVFSDETGSAIHLSILHSGSDDIRLLVSTAENITFGLDDGTASEINLAGGNTALGKWVDVAGVFDGTNQYLYVDGTLVNSTTDNFDFSTADGTLHIGARSAGNYHTKCRIADTRIYNRALTTAEVEHLHTYNTTTYDNDSSICVLNLEAKTGLLSGSTWRDQSGNNNHGTITGATLSAEAPSKKPRVLDGNLVYNGDFRIRPYTEAAQTQDGWLDGTATGAGAVVTPYRWYFDATASSASCQFDTEVTYGGKPSLKLSTLDATGKVRVSQTTVNGGASEKIANIPYLVKVKPNTDYRFTCYAKTNNVATNSVLAYIKKLQPDLTTSEVTTDRLTGTNDWTLLEKEFTTGANDVYLRIELFNSVAGNISDAWFSDISLTEV